MSMINYCQHIEEFENRIPLLALAAFVDRKLKMNESWRGNLDKILKLFGHSLSSCFTWEKLANRLIHTMKEQFEKQWQSSL